MVPAVASAQTDEIQVYDGVLAEPGKFNLTWHHNFTPIGQEQPAFPGGLVSDKAFIGVPEWAYGVTKWFEVGLYLPLYSITKNRGATLNGFKLRTLFAVPNANQRTFFYGVNFEYSYNAKQWEPRRFSSEIRPIIGWHLGATDLIINPIMDTEYNGLKNFEFAPATRVSHKFAPKWTLGLEEYGDYGPLRGFHPVNDQAHQLYFVADHPARGFAIEAGIGVGMTPSSDKLTIKLILSRDLN
jgi:hypothetical protein